MPILCAALLAACAKPEPPIPPPPPPPNFCTFYTPWLMSPAAAAYESVENLRTHAGNNAAHHLKCVVEAHEAKLDPARKGGPR